MSGRTSATPASLAQAGAPAPAPEGAPHFPRAGARQPRLVELPTRRDARGDLSFLEGGREIPFAIRRIYYMYGVPAGGSRGAHAHRRLEQLFIPLGGSFRLELDDGWDKRSLTLDRPSQGLYLPPMYWRDLTDFSPGATSLVLASAPYDEGDYIRDYARFLSEARGVDLPPLPNDP